MARFAAQEGDRVVALGLAVLLAALWWSRSKRTQLNDLSEVRATTGLAQSSPTRSMIPSTAIVSPSRFHHFASQT